MLGPFLTRLVPSGVDNNNPLVLVLDVLCPPALLLWQAPDYTSRWQDELTFWGERSHEWERDPGAT